MNTSLIITGLTNIINILMLVYLLREKNSENNLPRKSFAISVISLIAWSLCNFFADNSTAIISALFWTRLSFVTALCMGFSILVFSYTFPHSLKINKYSMALYGIPVVLFSFFSMTSLIIANVTLGSSGVSEVTIGSAYPAIVIMYLLFIVHSSANFIKSYCNLSGKYKSQIKFVLIGWTTFLTIALATNAILPLITGNADWSKFGPLGSIVMVGSITYAIVRHEFFDIKIIIQKGLVYSFLLSCITLTYLSLVFIFGFLLKGTGNVPLVSALITTLIGIFGVPPLRIQFQKITDPIFFKGNYDYLSVLTELTDVLNRNISLDTITEKTTKILISAFRADFIFFNLKNEPTHQEKQTTSFPIMSNRKKIGTLEVGPKRSGDSYTTRDISLIETFTKQAAIALEKASLYKQVKEYANTLEQKVEERTIEISKIQKEKESLMMEISHGLQTPLTIMKGELFFLRKQGYNNEKVDVIDASIDRISSFIYRLLSLSRIESNEISRDSLINLSELMRDLIKFFTITTGQHGITLSHTIPENIFVKGNREELDELISNIISNSIKYIGENEKTISVELSQENSVVKMIITDTGIGMREEDLKNLFQKFYRIKNDETKSIKGTGLGLTICKKIVDNLNGTIEVASVFSVGTTITISLPINSSTKA